MAIPTRRRAKLGVTGGDARLHHVEPVPVPDSDIENRNEKPEQNPAQAS